MSDKWEPCPRCGSNRVRHMGMAFFILMGLGSLSFGIILLLIPFIGVPLMVIGIAFLVLAQANCLGLCVFTTDRNKTGQCLLAWPFVAPHPHHRHRYNLPQNPKGPGH